MKNTCRECGGMFEIVDKGNRDFKAAKLDEVLQYYCSDCGVWVMLALIPPLPITRRNKNEF